MSTVKPKLDDLRIERPDKPQSQSRGWGWPAILVILLLAAVGVVLWFLRPKAIEVRTVLAREVSGPSAGAHTVLNASGYVTARRASTVSSKVTGKVTEIMVEEGMKVDQGQELARLDDTNVKASLRLSE